MKSKILSVKSVFPICEICDMKSVFPIREIRNTKSAINKSSYMKQSLFFLTSLILFLASTAQDMSNNPGSNHANKFEQLGVILPTPNEYRTASGAPGPRYWQQRCDYDIKGTLDEKNLKFTGQETITYFNNSPDVLTYLWLQLDENEHSTINNANYQSSEVMPRRMSIEDIHRAENVKKRQWLRAHHYQSDRCFRQSPEVHHQQNHDAR